MSIQENYKVVEPCAGRIHPTDREENVQSPGSIVNTLPLAYELMKLSNDEESEFTEWSDIPLTPGEEYERSRVVTGPSRLEVAGYLCDQYNLLTTITDSKNDVKFEDHKIKDLEHHMSHDEHCSASDDPGLSDQGTDVESLDTDLESTCESDEEENPRLSRHEAWQLQKQIMQDLGVNSQKSFQQGSAGKESGGSMSQYQLTQWLESIDIRDSPAESFIGSYPRGFVETRLSVSPKNTTRIAEVDSPHPFPRPNRPPIGTQLASPTEPQLASPIEPELAFPIEPQLALPRIGPNSEGLSGIDITEADEAEAFSPSMSTPRVSNIIRQGDESQHRPSKDSSPAVDESVLQQVLENSIRCTNKLLTSGKDEYALRKSQEIARLMESMLMANVDTLTGDPLSDLIDSSAWRG